MTTTTSSIIDGNAFDEADPASLAELSPSDRDLVLRRRRALGPSYRLFYERPVHLVRGHGSYVYGADGQEFLDAYNNVASIGHSHPAVVEAVHRQMAQLNTHSRYLQRGVIDYSEKLLTTFPRGLDHVMFTNSGSEANDLALRVAEAATGGRGVVVTSEAYHGTSAAVTAISPSIGRFALGPHVRTVPAPDTFRLAPPEGIGAWFGARVAEAFTDLRRNGYAPSALVLDSILSSDGVVTDTSVLAPAYAAARAAGAVVIADEVQPGFGRTGSAFWGYARHSVTPDIVTLGKPMGNGVPVAAMIASAAVLEQFGTTVPYFNTFGGSTVPVAAANAVLDTILNNRLADHAERLGAQLLDDLRTLQTRHPHIGDVRGAGLFFGIEIVAEPGGSQPAPARARAIVNALREDGVLVSVAGPHSTTVKARPLLSWGQPEADRFITALDDALARTAAR
ncbi:aminotransferase class III-fold pyridoxal phosphate-dependent enzyme [Microbacterium trichothecenolyticum]|uniref:Aminotransferase class III-fold pyridoxal phosphate-dependent enzyme n=1 Tax=Microbacterium ureisolvens TaxID=2781186 RepID=A0ABS7I2T9_9MICO|nr:MULTISPECIES: aminotransferase class III-fold pyridoxal phosphate-dependent enzyme [Microbacterium]MBW9111984.1 aminotransferase class III-fold pyridoxal phosphate-dependent enzyme [Microbacterium ureisolvens]MBW9122407.1 aminotransferase class III-fold pyridoxal phosphate-dependent enzyme [Microbacterium trichothecenolyticum]